MSYYKFPPDLDGIRQILMQLHPKQLTQIRDVAAAMEDGLDLEEACEKAFQNSQPKCWWCGSREHLPNACPQREELSSLTVEQLLGRGFRWLEGGGLVHPSYLGQ